MRLLSVKASLLTIFVMTMLICIGKIQEWEHNYKRRGQVSTMVSTTAADETTAAETTTTPIICPKSDILTYTDGVEELSQLLPFFNFSLTPWAVQYDWDKNQSDPDVKWSMIVMVKSHSKNIQARRIARLTWTRLNHYNGVIMKTIFIVGKAENPQAEYQLLKENKYYGDLLQIDREERYKDVVFKTLAGMQYAGSHFPCDWIYVSADDDIMPYLTKIHEDVEHFITEQNNIVSEGSTSCKRSASLKILCGWGLIPKAYVRRKLRDRWFVNETDYPHKFYPPYCNGPWYSMRIFHVKELYDLARRYPIFWIDDVWITGTLRLMHIRNDEDVLCTPKELSWGLVGERSVTVGETDDLIKSWIDYSEKHKIL